MEYTELKEEKHDDDSEVSDEKSPTIAVPIKNTFKKKASHIRVHTLDKGVLKIRGLFLFSFISFICLFSVSLYLTGNYMLPVGGHCCTNLLIICIFLLLVHWILLEYTISTMDRANKASELAKYTNIF